MITMEEMLTAKDVARILRIDVYTARELLKTKKLRGFKIGSQWKVKQEDLRNFVAAQLEGN